MAFTILVIPAEEPESRLNKDLDPRFRSGMTSPYAQRRLSNSQKLEDA